MNKNKLLILFCITLPIFLLLFSYKTTIYFTDLTIEQQNAFGFLDDKRELEGYTANEVSHMQDVKQVLKFSNYLFYISLLILTLILTYYKRDKIFTAKLLKYGGVTTLSVMSIILLETLSSFNSSFTFFHKIFFPQGNWLFPGSSKLIQIFPLEFFITISRNIFLITIFLSILFIVVSYYLKNDLTQTFNNTKSE